MNKPKIRIKGFKEEWNEVSLGDTGITISGIGFPENEQGGTDGYPFYKVSDMNNIGNESIMVKSNNYVSELQIKKHSWKVCKNVPAIFFAKVGAAVMLNRKRLVLEPCLFDNNTMLYCLDKDKWDVEFSLPMFETIDLAALAQVGSLPSYNGAMVESIKIKIPTLIEQQQIGNFFRSLDSIIQSADKKLASLKQIKAASLQSMFPQNNETKPKVIFKGFEGEWEKKSFEETFDTLTNNSLSRDLLSPSGEVMNVHYGDVLIKFGDIIDLNYDILPCVKDNNVGHRLVKSCSLKDGDIIIADAAEDNTVGKCSEILNVKEKMVVSGLHTIPCRPKLTFSHGYLGYFINSSLYHDQLLPLIQGSKISSISKSLIKNTIIYYPTDISEQQKIASYFRSLDNQISLQAKQLGKLKQIKTACLDKMFV